MSGNRIFPTKSSVRGTKNLPLYYKGIKLKRSFQPDFVCFDKIIVEIKAVSNISEDFRSKMLSYLHTTKYQLGILVNFGHFPNLEYERFALTQSREDFQPL